MEIEAHAWGTNWEYFDLYVKTDNATISEENLSYEEAVNLAIGFLEDTVLLRATRVDIIDRLIEADVLDEEMIAEWMKDKDVLS